MDEDIFETLRKLEESIKNPSFNYYIYYDSENGKVMHIRNYKDESDPLPMLVIRNDEFDRNSISIHSHSVIEVDGKKTLKKIVNLYKTPPVDDFIHLIPKKEIKPKVKISEKTFEFDLLIEQDNIKKEFRVRLSKELRDQASVEVGNDRKLMIFVTATNDPNILYKTLEVPMQSLVQDNYYSIKFDDYDGESSNIYSIRYFKQYLHLDIRK
jgi:hypothetical protein